MKCVNTPAGHDWVLVPQDDTDYFAQGGAGIEHKLLWACPCGEFKWTSYAEWEKGQEMEVMTSNPNQGESTAAGHIIDDIPASGPGEEQRRRVKLEKW